MNDEGRSSHNTQNSTFNTHHSTLDTLPNSRGPSANQQVRSLEVLAIPCLQGDHRSTSASPRWRWRWRMKEPPALRLQITQAAWPSSSLSSALTPTGWKRGWFDTGWKHGTTFAPSRLTWRSTSQGREINLERINRRFDHSLVPIPLSKERLPKRIGEQRKSIW